MGFTGYLLPWDQTAYWATVVGINLNGTAPFAGPWLAQFLATRAGDRSDTLAKWYALHMLLIPGALIALIVIHIYLVTRLGVASPPWSSEAAGRERPPVEPTGARAGLVPGQRRRRLMARDLGELNREDYARYKDDVKKEGKAFFPRAMLHDTVMSLVVVCVIIAPRGHLVLRRRRRVEPGILGPWYTEPADPGTTDFIPRPDWYFYFLFYLLRIFEWPETVFIATVGIPTMLPDPPHRPAVLRPAARAAPVPAAGGDGRSVADGPLDGRADVEGRDRGGGARLRAHRARARSGQKSRASRATRRPRRGRSCSRSRAACNCHTYLGQGCGQPGRARPLGDRRRRTTPRTSSQYLTNPGAVREHRDGLVLVPRRGEPRRARRVPRGLEGRSRVTVAARLPRPSSEPPDTLDRARLPRRDRRLRRSVRRAPAPRSRRRRLRGRARGVPLRDRGARHRALRRSLAPARRGARALRRQRGATGDGLRRERLPEPVRERLGAGRRVRDLPVLDGDRRNARLRARCRTSSTAPPRSRSRSAASSCSSRVRRRSRRSISAGSRR